MALSSLALFTFLLLDLAILLVYHERRLRFQLNAGLMLVVSFYAYTSALPVSRLLFGTESGGDVDLSFMFDSLLAAFGLTLGLALCPRFVGISRDETRVWQAAALKSKPLLRQKATTWLIVGAVASAAYYFFYVSNFKLDIFAGAYGRNNTVTEANQTLSDTLLIPFAICAMLHGFFAVRIKALKSHLTRIVQVLFVIFLFMFLAQGHRNLMIYLGLPVIALRWYGRPIRLGTVAICGLLAFVGFYGIGIVRNWGWFDLGSVNVGENAFDPLHGELGASYSVYEKLDARQDVSLKYGKTYTIDSIVNLVPHPVWRTRPPSPAEQFSRDYYGTNQLRSGLGFSPLVECMMNFSRVGIVMVFAITAVLFVRVDKWARARGRVGILIASVLLPSIVNWNRIDFAAFSKMFLIYAAFLWGLDWLLYRVPTAPLVHTARQAKPVGRGSQTLIAH